MSRRVAFRVGTDDAGRRLDAVVADRVPGLSRSSAQKLIDDGGVQLNGLPAKGSRRLNADDLVEVGLGEPAPLTAEPENIPLQVVYHDSDLAVIDKPAGLVVHPAAGHHSGTLANALAALFPQAPGVGRKDRPGIVHRLDKNTSGLMVVALNPAAQQSLQRQIAQRTAERSYLALACGHLAPTRATIEAPIGRDPRDRKRMAPHGIAARPAQTSYRVLEYLPDLSFLEARLHTGRTHQIRVHLAGIGHPIAGDEAYGGAALPGLHRQFLHAYRLSLCSPSSGELLTFSSPLPPELQRVLEDLRGEAEARTPT